MALVYLLKCNGHIVDCITDLLDNLEELGSFVAIIKIKDDARQCLEDQTTITPLSPDISQCTGACNVSQNPNIVLCMQGCWAQEPPPSKACISLFIE